jgi:hypothetical protein
MLEKLRNTKREQQRKKGKDAEKIAKGNGKNIYIYICITMESTSKTLVF